MEEITLNSWATFTSLAVLFLMSLFSIGWLLVRWGKYRLARDKENELRYKLMYRDIQRHTGTYQNLSC